MIDGFTPWPADLAARYRAEGYWQDRYLGDLLHDWAERWGDHEALAAGDERLTYRDLARTSDRLALRLLDLGIGRNDRVVVQLPNTAEFVVLTFALFRIGALPVMALPAHRRREVGYLATFSEAVAYAIPDRLRDFDFQAMVPEVTADAPSLKHILVAGDAARGHVDLRALIAEPAAEDDAKAVLDARRPDPGDVAMFLLSGGTTGLPKLIPRTHNDYAYNFHRCAELAHADEATVYMVSLPASHNFPLGCPGILGTLASGGRVVMCPSPRPEAALPLIERERVTITAVVPAVALQWLDAPARTAHDLSSLKVLQVGGSRFAPEAGHRVAPELGCRLQQAFGMAEGLINLTRLDDPEDEIVETQGRPMCEADEVRIVDGDGNPVPSGEPGELLTRGPYTLRGYFKAPEHNARAFSPDGFYRTGDIVRLSARGNLIVEGREKDLINRGGEKISAEEIENLILSHDAVANVAAVAMPDPVLGERVCVYVECRAGAALDLDGLRAFLTEAGIAGFKLPERLETVDALPLTNVGKVDKKALRDDIAAKLAES